MKIGLANARPAGPVPLPMDHISTSTRICVDMRCHGS